jgi:hypothetical protein
MGRTKRASSNRERPCTRKEEEEEEEEGRLLDINASQSGLARGRGQKERERERERERKNGPFKPDPLNLGENLRTILYVNVAIETWPNFYLYKKIQTRGEKPI